MTGGGQDWWWATVIAGRTVQTSRTAHGYLAHSATTEVAAVRQCRALALADVQACDRWLTANGHTGNSTRVRAAIAKIGDEWATIRAGASRYYMHKLQQRYPHLEFRHHNQGAGWLIEARLRPGR